MFARSDGKSAEFSGVLRFVLESKSCSCFFFFSAGILAGSMCMDDTLAALVSGTLAGIPPVARCVLVLNS